MILTLPAAYRRHFEAAILRALNEVRLDRELRDDEDARIRALAGVSDDLIDAAADGNIVVVISDSSHLPVVVH